MDILQTDFQPATLYKRQRLVTHPFSPTHSNYLLYFGYVSKQYGVHYIVEIAKYLNANFVIAALPHGLDQAYFDACIKPHLSTQIRWLGEIEEDTQLTLMSRAACLLYPCFTTPPAAPYIEDALATGCPVIAFESKYEQELVVHGKTGYIVPGVEEMIDAVHAIGSIKRDRCRRHALAYEINTS